MADLFETEDLEDDSDDQTSSSIATEQAETESEVVINFLSGCRVFFFMMFSI